MVEGLGVSTNLMPPLLELSVRVFLSPTERQDIACDIALTICCGLTLVAWVAFKFSISHFCCSISFVWTCIFLSLLLPFFWEWVLLSTGALDKLILFVAVLTFGILIRELNVEMHWPWNWVKFILWPCVFKKLHAIAARYGLHNWEINCVFSASFT